MIARFVETPKKGPGGRRPDRFRPPIWTVVFMGCLLINTVTLSFIPMSQISSFDVSLLFLVLVVLPLLFLSLFLASKFGYGILFAAFLSIPGGIVSVLILGDFVAVLLDRNIVENIQVREATYYPLAKIFVFRDPILDFDKAFHSTQALPARERPGGSDYRAPVYHSLVPILDPDHREGEEVSAFAVCTHSLETFHDCAFHYPGINGGFQVSENLRSFLRNIVREHEEKLHFQAKNSPIFVFWTAKPRERILQAGWYGLGFVFFLNLFWMGSVYLYERLQKKN